MASKPHVAVVIPTFNRAGFVQEAVASALCQDYEDTDVLILDDSTSDATQQLFDGPSDSRLSYIRNPSNLGLVRNWNQAFERTDRDFVVLLQDDDRLGEGFVRRGVDALTREPDAIFACCLAELIDETGAVISAQAMPSLGAGLIVGSEYLERIVAGENWIIHISSVMWRREAVPPGPFDAPHTTHTTDFNLFFRAASASNFVLLDEHLVQVRSHRGQSGREHLGPKAAFGMVSERTDAVAYLLAEDRAADAAYRSMLAERLLALSHQRSLFARQLEPSMGMPESQRLQLAISEVVSATSALDRLVLIDNYELGDLPGRSVERFGERSGLGTPPNSESAVLELERMRKGGATCLVIAWPLIWWLDFFDGLRSHLQRNYRQTLRTSRVVVYDLDRANQQRGD